jgi:hypothetical protein
MNNTNTINAGFVAVTVTAAEIRRAYNNGKATGESRFTPASAPTCYGVKINRMVFGRYGVVTYFDAAETMIAKFDGCAILDD